jgi:hypothetical protein
MRLPPLRVIFSTFLPSAAADGPARRDDSCPPLARSRSSGWKPSLRSERSRSAALAAARLDFAEALRDVRTPAALDVQARIAVSRSLHDLWHFREEVFSLVSCRHSQAEAARRMDALNVHFRASRRAATGARGDPASPDAG